MEYTYYHPCKIKEHELFVCYDHTSTNQLTCLAIDLSLYIFCSRGHFYYETVSCRSMSNTTILTIWLLFHIYFGIWCISDYSCLRQCICLGFLDGEFLACHASQTFTSPLYFVIKPSHASSFHNIAEHFSIYYYISYFYEINTPCIWGRKICKRHIVFTLYRGKI